MPGPAIILLAGVGILAVQRTPVSPPSGPPPLPGNIPPGNGGAIQQAATQTTAPAPTGDAVDSALSNNDVDSALGTIQSVGKNIPLAGAVITAAISGALLGHAAAKAIFTNSQTPATDNAADITFTVAGGGTATAAVVLVWILGASAAIPIVGEIVIIAVVLLMAVFSIIGAIEEDERFAQYGRYFDAVNAYMAQNDFANAFNVAISAANNGYTGVGFTVGIWALSDNDVITDSKGVSYSVKASLCKAYYQGRAIGDTFSRTVAQALPWIGCLNGIPAEDSGFLATCTDAEYALFRTQCEQVKSDAELVSKCFSTLYRADGITSPALLKNQKPVKQTLAQENATDAAETSSQQTANAGFKNGKNR